MTITIPGVLPSSNAVMRWHWTRRARLWREWSRAVWAATRATPRTRSVQDPVAVEVVHHRARLLDPDNAVAAAKPLLDALVAAGLVYDDSPRYLTSLAVRQCRCRTREQRVEASIRPAAPPKAAAGGNGPVSRYIAPLSASSCVWRGARGCHGRVMPTLGAPAPNR